MCFSNLPIEFDDGGNPYLAEEPEGDHFPCDCGDATSIEDDPERAYAAIVESVPDEVRQQLDDGQERRGDADTAEGD